MKTRILTILREKQEYVSGQELCEKLGVSRTAIWKNINLLKKEGYEIEAVQNKGYKILNTPDRITKEELASLFAKSKVQHFGETIYYEEELTSTNTVAKQLGEQGAKDGLLVVADMQSQGRGRRGRTWSSPKGSSIYMTLMLKPKFSPDLASMLTLVMGLSVVQSMNELYELDAKIKWPNDIVLNRKKVCGILTEMSAQVDYINYLVIGVGINVNNDSFPDEVLEVATSIAAQLGHTVKRSELIVRIMEKFEDNYKIFLMEHNLGKLVKDYNKVLISLNQEIRVLEPKNEYNGIARGINELGELLVETQNQEIVTVYAGEVSVRGLYGYV